MAHELGVLVEWIFVSLLAERFVEKIEDAKARRCSLNCTIVCIKKVYTDM
jgi:hypothetical protein